MADHWCQPCNSFHLQQEFNNWKSGNNNIDEIIKEIQATATSRHRIIEWIPYSKLNNVTFVTKGDFGEVYSAEWTDGYILHWNRMNSRWKRKGITKVALKCLDYSINITNKILSEIRDLCDCSSDKSHITRCYGITRHKETNNFIIVMQFIDHGSIRNYLDVFHEINYREVFSKLLQIAEGLRQVHEAGLIHRNLHTGNILLSERGLPYITDLGFCKSVMEFTSDAEEKKVYGVLPYMAPEVLRGEEYTKEADVYALGIIIYEVLSGVPPFHNIPHDNDLAINICKGLRPEISANIPDLEIDLIQKCWDAEPHNRLSSHKLCDTLKMWRDDYPSFWNPEIVTKIEESYSGVSNSSTRNEIQMHPSAIYTSQYFNFKDLPEPKNLTTPI